jgi:hypothetical protein
MTAQGWQKWYTRVIGVFFILVALSLLADLLKFGVRLETWHKVFHIGLGLVVVRYGWNDRRWWQPFCRYTGAFFALVGLVGWIFPDLGGLDAFNRVDTILHTLVGVSGLVIGWKK